MNYILFILLFFSTTLIADECVYQINGKKQVFIINDKFGCEYENRELHSYEFKDFKFKFNKNKNNDIVLQFLDADNLYKTFDILPFSSPESEKVRDVVFFPDKKLLILLHGFRDTILNENNEIEVDAAFYNTSVYKIYNKTPIKLLNRSDINLSGIDGFYNNKMNFYPYKNHHYFLEKAKNITISPMDTLSSLAIFLKPDYGDKFDTPFSFYSGLFSKKVIEFILQESHIETGNVEQYNNIAFYLEKYGAFDEAILILQEIIQKFPQRLVAYLNLGDAYWGKGKEENAIGMYQKYIHLMRQNGKENKIPSYINKRIKGNVVVK